MDRRRFCLASAAAALAPATVRAGEPQAASAADLAGDIRLLREALTAIHPGLYRYLSKAEAADGFERLERQFRNRPNLSAAYLHLSAFLARIRCGHTYANFYNQSETVADALFASRTRLPFRFRWIGQRMVVTSDHAGPDLARGAEIVAVEGVKAGDILRELTRYVRADGGNDGKRRALLEISGADDYETFDIFHALHFGPFRDRLTLKVRDCDSGRTRRIDVAPIDLAARRAMKKADNEDEERMGWRLDWPHDRLACLTMPNWVAYNTKWDWKGFLDAAFKEMADRRALGLIVDLRANEGGNDCGDEIIARLIDAPFSPEAEERRVRYKKTPEALNAFLETWDDGFRDWGERAIPREDGFYSLAADGDRDRQIAPKGPKFVGEVAVLIGPQNSSATFRFASLMRAHRLGTLIGETTGGNQRGINGGAFFFLRLPASGLEVDVPIIGYYPKRPDVPDGGLAPDIEAPWTAEAILEGRDPAMEAALNHIKA